MRSLLFLLIGLALACLIGFAEFPSPAETIEPSAATATSDTEPPLLMLGALVLGSWASLLIRRSFWLRVLLTTLIVAAGGIAVLGGAMSAYWDHYMRPGSTVGWWFLGAGALMLLSQWVGWSRSARDRLDR